MLLRTRVQCPTEKKKSEISQAGRDRLKNVYKKSGSRARGSTSVFIAGREENNKIKILYTKRVVKRNIPCYPALDVVLIIIDVFLGINACGKNVKTKNNEIQ